MIHVIYYYAFYFLIQMEISSPQKNPRSFLHGQFLKFPATLKFPNKSVFSQTAKSQVSIFVSRNFQFPPHICKTGNFAATVKEPLPAAASMALTALTALD